jgi:AraC-like DNA-binding protein
MPLHAYAPRATSQLLHRISIVSTSHETTRTVLPDAGLVIGLRYRGDTLTLDTGVPRAYPHRSLTGVLPRAQTVRTSAGGAMILGLVRPDAAARLLRAPVDDLFGVTCSLDDIFPPSTLHRVVHALYRATSDDERIAIFERFLLDAAPPRPPDPIVTCALAAIDRAAGNVRIAALRVGRSQDALERRFRALVGATPKHYASLVRFRRALALIRPGRSLTRIALEAGYSDQSHFNRHFRRFTGHAPSVLLAGDYC